MATEQATMWVVYRTPVRNRPGTITAVCAQNEWDAMELSRPGFYTLVRAGITNEGEAERLARTESVVAAG